MLKTRYMTFACQPSIYIYIYIYIYLYIYISSIDFLFLHRFSLRLSSSFIKPFWASMAPSNLCTLIMRLLSAISDRAFSSLDHNDFLVPRSSMSTSQLCFCFSRFSIVELSPCKNLCSNSLWLIFLYSSPSKSFLFSGVCCTGGRGASD